MKKHYQSKEAQIRKKIAESGITKSEDFQEIISNLITQRERLEIDLKVLRGKVIALQQKKEKSMLNNTQKKRGFSRKQEVNYREQLNKKYQILKNWQKKSNNALNNSAIAIEYRAYLDKLFSIEQQIQLCLKQYNDERKTNVRLRKALKLIHNDDQININAQSGIQRQNHLLKKRLFSLRKIVDKQLSKEIDLQKILFDMKDKERQNRERERQSKMMSRNQMRSRQPSEFEGRKNRIKTQVIRTSKQSIDSQPFQQIIYLQIEPSKIVSKEQIYQIQGRMNRLIKKFSKDLEAIEKNLTSNYPNQALKQKREGSKLTFGQEFQLILQKTKKNIGLLTEVQKHQIQLLFQIKDSNFAQIQESQKGIEGELLFRGAKGYNSTAKMPTFQNSKFKRIQTNKSRTASDFSLKRSFLRTQEQSIQVNSQNLGEVTFYRRQFVGIIGEHQFNDRQMLGNQKHSSIRCLEIYYSDRGIATVRAIYNIIHDSYATKQSKVTLPQFFLKSYCKVHKIDTNDDDFIRYFKVKYNTAENRILSIKTVSNRNHKNGWGDYKIKKEGQPIADTNEVQIQPERQVEKQIVFDINKDEYPASIFCSHFPKGPYWYLCGFGVEINDL